MTYDFRALSFLPPSLLFPSALLMAHQVKNLPTMQETQEMWVRSLGQEGLLENEMETHSSILAWKIPRTEEPGGGTIQRVSKNWTQLSLQVCLCCLFLRHSVLVNLSAG